VSHHEEVCPDVHTRAAKGAGATREEVTEAALLAAALQAGARCYAWRAGRKVCSIPPERSSRWTTWKLVKLTRRRYVVHVLCSVCCSITASGN
jgi:hypothetical protein